jgi:hypothetical protein
MQAEGNKIKFVYFGVIIVLTLSSNILQFCVKSKISSFPEESNFREKWRIYLIYFKGRWDSSPIRPMYLLTFSMGLPLTTNEKKCSAPVV